MSAHAGRDGGAVDSQLRVVVSRNDDFLSPVAQDVGLQRRIRLGSVVAVAAFERLENFHLLLFLVEFAD